MVSKRVASGFELAHTQSHVLTFKSTIPSISSENSCNFYIKFCVSKLRPTPPYATKIIGLQLLKSCSMASPGSQSIVLRVLVWKVTSKAYTFLQVKHSRPLFIFTKKIGSKNDRNHNIIRYIYVHTRKMNEEGNTKDSHFTKKNNSTLWHYHNIDNLTLYVLCT